MAAFEESLEGLCASNTKAFDLVIIDADKVAWLPSGMPCWKLVHGHKPPKTTKMNENWPPKTRLFTIKKPLKHVGLGGSMVVRINGLVISPTYWYKWILE